MPPWQPLTDERYDLMPVTRSFLIHTSLWSFHPKPAPETQYCHASFKPFACDPSGEPSTRIT